MNTNKDRIYLGALFLTMAVFSILKWEPAVFDVFMVILFIWGIAKGYFTKPNRTLLYPIVLLLVLAAVNLLYFTHYSELPKAIHFSVITFYCMFVWLTFIMILNYFQIRGFHCILYGYAISALLSALIGIIAYSLGYTTDLLFYMGYRVEVLFKDPNVFGPFMVPMIIVSLAVMWGGQVRHKWLWQSVYVLCTLALVLSFSRAAYLNLGIALVVALVLLLVSKTFCSREGLGMIVSGSLVILLGLGFLSLSDNVHGNNMTFQQTLFKRAGYQHYDNERFNGQEHALQLSLKNTWGIGPGQSLSKLGIDTHNTFLRVALENGWLGLLSLIGFLALSIYRSLRLSLRRSSSRRLLYICTTSVLIGIMANSLFIDTLHWRHLWLFLALAWVEFKEEPDELGWY